MHAPQTQELLDRVAADLRALTEQTKGLPNSIVEREVERGFLIGDPAIYRNNLAAALVIVENESVRIAELE